jgi:hypothetical protein
MAIPIFNSGTKTVFQQTSAPTGWTKDTVNYNNHALRVVNGSVSSGGTLDFSTVFTTTPYSFTNFPFSPARTSNTSLSTSNLPVHTHPITNAPNTGATLGTPIRFFPGVAPFPPAPSPTYYSTVASVANLASSGTTATSNSLDNGHNHPLTITASGTVCNIDLKYVDVIIASLD